MGLERQIRGHPAGIRTHALVSTGAALFALVGVVDRGTQVDSGVVDSTRIAAQVVSGLGFIAAGAILRDRRGIRGLTTAATIWISGALGVGFASGNYVLAAGTLGIVFVVLVVLRALRPVGSWLGSSTVSLELRYEIGYGTLGPVMEAAKEVGATIDLLTIEDTPRGLEPDIRHLRIVLLGQPDESACCPSRIGPK